MDKKKDIRLFDSGTRILAAAIAFSVSFWFLESYIHAYILFRDNAFATHFFHPNLHELWMRVAVMAMMVGLGLYARRLVMVRKEADAALVESEKRMRAVADTVMVAIVMVDSDANIIYWNPGAETVFGYTAEEAVGSNMTRLIVPHKYHKAVIKGLASFRDTGEGSLLGHTVEMTGMRKDGTEFPMEHSVSAVRLKGGWCAVGIIRDISWRKQAEEALLESEKRFRMFFENEPAYCYIISPEGTIQDVNEAAFKTLGYEKAELLGRPVETIYAPEMLPRTKEVFERWKSTGEVEDEEMEIVTKGGERRTVLLSAGSVRAADGRLLYSVSVQSDVTERKRLEDELKERLHETERMNRLMVGRELAMVRLKAKVKALEERLKGREES